MNYIDIDKVTSILFSIDGESHPRIRFVLNPHREEMCEMEKEMDENGCEPLLVVDRKNENVWWTDDYMFAVDQMGLDESEETDAYKWALMVTESNVWWTCDGGVIFRTREGTVVRATVSTMPCDRAHGMITDDCEPIE